MAMRSLLLTLFFLFNASTFLAVQVDQKLSTECRNDGIVFSKKYKLHPSLLASSISVIPGVHDFDTCVDRCCLQSNCTMAVAMSRECVHISCPDSAEEHENVCEPVKVLGKQSNQLLIFKKANHSDGGGPELMMQSVSSVADLPVSDTDGEQVASKKYTHGRKKTGKRPRTRYRTNSMPAKSNLTNGETKVDRNQTAVTGSNWLSPEEPNLSGFSNLSFGDPDGVAVKGLNESQGRSLLSLKPDLDESQDWADHPIVSNEITSQISKVGRTVSNTMVPVQSVESSTQSGFATPGGLDLRLTHNAVRQSVEQSPYRTSEFHSGTIPNTVYSAADGVGGLSSDLQTSMEYPSNFIPRQLHSVDYDFSSPPEIRSSESTFPLGASKVPASDRNSINSDIVLGKQAESYEDIQQPIENGKRSKVSSLTPWTDSDYGGSSVSKETFSVSAGGNLTVILPVNSVTLHAKVHPSREGQFYQYSWAQTSAPIGSHAVMEGGTTDTALLSRLDQPGLYTFKVTVWGRLGLAEDTTHVTVFPAATSSEVTMLIKNQAPTQLQNKSTFKDNQRPVLLAADLALGEDSINFDQKSISSASTVPTAQQLDLPVASPEITTSNSKAPSSGKTARVKNSKPVSDAGPDIVVKLPNREALLDGTGSTDDHGSLSFIWVRDPLSPVFGDVLNKSDHLPVLHLANLVVGTYTFILTVKDEEGLESSDSAVIHVLQDEHSMGLLELLIDSPPENYQEQNLMKLIQQLAADLNVLRTSVHVTSVRPAGFGERLILTCYVSDLASSGQIKDAQEVVESLKESQALHILLTEHALIRIEPLVCRNNCSGHGVCHPHTKLCVCRTFRMENFFRSYYSQSSNCDWNVFFFSMGVGATAVVLIISTWIVLFLRKRRRLTRKKRDYRIVEDDDFKMSSLEDSPKASSYGGLRMLLDSDMDSEEMTLFDKRRLKQEKAVASRHGCNVFRRG